MLEGVPAVTPEINVRRGVVGLYLGAAGANARIIGYVKPHDGQFQKRQV
jgi:hypothetical protein